MYWVTCNFDAEEDIYTDLNDFGSNPFLCNSLCSCVLPCLSSLGYTLAHVGGKTHNPVDRNQSHINV